MTTDKDIFQQAQEAIETGDADAAVQLAKQGLEQGVDGIELLNNGFIVGINKVGDLFGEGQLFLPELIMSATAMQGVIEIINAAWEKWLLARLKVICMILVKPLLFRCCGPMDLT